jgi:branched-chain amino acid transport system substrate-binding protein
MNMKSTKPVRTGLASALLALLLIPGCSRSGDTIRIGQYASLTGKEAAFGQSSHNGTLLAIEEINAAGGILGKQIELITEDDQSRQGEPATVVKKLIARDGVVALLGEVASSRSLEGAQVAQAEGIPMVTPSSTNPAVTETGDYIFRVCFIDPFQGTVMAKFARETLRANRVAVMTSVSNAYSVGLSSFFKERFAADGGTIAVEQRFTEGDKDFRAQLTAIRSVGVDAVFVPGYYTEAALIAKQARELGITVPLFGGDGWEAPQLLEIGGEAMNGTYFSTHYSSENRTAQVEDFVRKYQARFNGATPDAIAALGYDSAMVLADAIRRAGAAEPALIRDALAQTRDFAGVTGITTIDENRNASKSAVIIAVQDGQFRFQQAVSP